MHIPIWLSALIADEGKDAFLQQHCHVFPTIFVCSSHTSLMQGSYYHVFAHSDYGKALFQRLAAFLASKCKSGAMHEIDGLFLDDTTGFTTIELVGICCSLPKCLFLQTAINLENLARVVLFVCVAPRLIPNLRNFAVCT